MSEYQELAQELHNAVENWEIAVQNVAELIHKCSEEIDLEVLRKKHPFFVDSEWVSSLIGDLQEEEPDQGSPERAKNLADKLVQSLDYED